MSTSGSKFTSTTDVQDALRQGLLQRTLVCGQEFYECCLCKRSMAGIVPAVSHLQGTSHSKALRKSSPSASLSEIYGRSNVLSSFTSAGNIAHSMHGDQELLDNAVKSGEITIVKDINVYMKCNICNISCTGDVSMAQHIKGDQHRKKLRTMASPTGVLETSSASALATTDQDIPAASSQSMPQDEVLAAISNNIVASESCTGLGVLRCKVCDMSCTGFIPMQAHLNGQAHSKKLRMHSLVSMSVKTTNTRSHLVEMNSGPEMQTEQRKEDIAHASSVSQSILEESKANAIVLEENGLLQCLICSLEFTCPSQMNEHLLGDHHRRKLREHIEIEQLYIQEAASGQGSTAPPQVPSLSTTNSLFNIFTAATSSPNRSVISGDTAAPLPQTSEASPLRKIAPFSNIAATPPSIMSGTSTFRETSPLDNITAATSCSPSVSAPISNSTCTKGYEYQDQNEKVILPIGSLSSHTASRRLVLPPNLQDLLVYFPEDRVDFSNMI